ncbi:MAG: nucleotidyltransferase family protein [Lachnospiraceae bacterium]|nr:nucleotidyltransferase family protein [Lachnospiraceae bacterium]
MKILGIIAEYNPFHNGHAYQLDKAKKASSADYTIAIMSGNFLQRGEPALFDKYYRTKLALAGGISAVYELPIYYATAGADEFAAAGVLSLDALGATHISFGAECDDIKLLSDIANAELKETDSFKNNLNNNLENGMTYAAAYSKALSDEFKDSEIEDILLKPNNRLAISYIKAVLKYCPHMKMIPIKREGADYNEKDIKGDICSASAIRELFANEKDVKALSSKLKQVVPENVFEIINEELLKGSEDPRNVALTIEDFYIPIAYSLLSPKEDILDMSDSIKNRISGLHDIPVSTDDLIKALKTKDVTEARIRRVLLHILLDIKGSVFEKAKSNNYINYLRLLGMKKEAAPLIKCQRACQKNNIVFIQKLTEGEARLKALGLDTSLLSADLRAAKFYDLIYKRKVGIDIDSDYITNSIIL